MEWVISKMDSYLKSIIKAFSYRVIATVLTFLVCYKFTGKAGLSMTITAAELVVKTVAYYIHERFWTKVLD